MILFSTAVSVALAVSLGAARADAESPPVVVDTPSHEVYLQDPGVLAGLVGDAPRGSAG